MSSSANGVQDVLFLSFSVDRGDTDCSDVAPRGLPKHRRMLKSFSSAKVSFETALVFKADAEPIVNLENIAQDEAIAEIVPQTVPAGVRFDSSFKPIPGVDVEKKQDPAVSNTLVLTIVALAAALVVVMGCLGVHVYRKKTRNLHVDQARPQQRHLVADFVTDSKVQGLIEMELCTLESGVPVSLASPCHGKHLEKILCEPRAGSTPSSSSSRSGAGTPLRQETETQASDDA